ncbi:MAG TPA: hypothetical protein PKD72_10855 [Gemmatales bacterium]|nr:hypothetical protein [Gemmatales bacterium]
MKQYWAATLLLTLCSVVLLAQEPPAQLTPPPVGVGFNERVVEKLVSPEDREANIWMLDFHFKDPRILRTQVPTKDGLKTKITWYLWYQISNATGEPRNFTPRFVWLCHDENTVHHDQVLHTVQREVQKIEDEQNILDIKNSWTIGKEPIPVSKEFDVHGNRIAFPLRVTGVATWDDINPKSTQFSILVFGLSNGFVKVDGPDGKEIVRVKTLQLNFKRIGDDDNLRGQQVKFVNYKWIYATTPEALPLEASAKEEDK